MLGPLAGDAFAGRISQFRTAPSGDLGPPTVVVFVLKAPLPEARDQQLPQGASLETLQSRRENGPFERRVVCVPLRSHRRGVMAGVAVIWPKGPPPARAACNIGDVEAGHDERLNLPAAVHQALATQPCRITGWGGAAGCVPVETQHPYPGAAVFGGRPEFSESGHLGIAALGALARINVRDHSEFANTMRMRCTFAHRA